MFQSITDYFNVHRNTKINKQKTPTFRNFSIQKSSELGILIKRPKQLFLEVSLHFPETGFLVLELALQGFDLVLHLVVVNSQSRLV